VKGERRCRAQQARFLLTLALVLPLVLSVGCAAKKVRIYDSGFVPQDRQNIIQYASTLIGKPYRNAAKGPDAFDCSGLVYYVYKRFDIGLPVSTDGLSRIGWEIGGDDVAAADLVLFRIKRNNHVGIMINSLEFIHASKSRGVTVDSLETRYWRRNLSQFRRVMY
jgi:cell wall-associated NlpC family hydrolase